MSRSRQNSFFSERDEDFFDQMEDNKSKLSMMGLYEPFSENNTFNYCDNLRDSLLAAKLNINHIIKNTEEVLYEKYLESRKDQYAIAQSLLLGELYFNMAVQMQDREQEDEMNIDDLEDNEPKRPIGESWIRSKISVEHHQELNSKSYILQSNQQITKRSVSADMPQEDTVEKHDKQYSEITSFTYRHRSIKKKEEVFRNDVPQPQNMEIPQEVDDIIERLRVIKQLETKRKEEKEEQEKKEKQKNPVDLKKEMKNSKYTYDFDGKIINTKVVKTDKLPPSNYAINYFKKQEINLSLIKSYQFSTQEVDRNKIKKLKAQQEEQQKQAQLQLQQQQQQQQKGKGSFLNLPQNNQINKDDQGLGQSKIQIMSKNPFSYDDFNPSQGVTLYYDQRIKEGPRSKEVFDTLANLDQRLKMNDDKLQITRSEYKRLTENGNLNMASTIKNMQDQIANQHGFSALNKPGQQGLLTNRSQSMMDNILGSQKNIQQSPQTGNKNLVLDDQNSKNKKSYFLSSLNHPHINPKGDKEDFLSILENSKSKITVKSPGLISNIIVKEEELQQVNTEKANDKLKLPAINEKNSLPQKSPVDDFNQQIMKGGDWGKGNRGVGSVMQGKPIHKPDKKVFRTTLNQQYKLPRERDWGQSFKLSKSSKHLLKTNTSEGSITQPEVEFRGTFYTFNSKFSETLRSFKA